MIVTAGTWLMGILEPAERRLRVFHAARMTVFMVPLAAITALLVYRWRKVSA